MFGHRCEKTAPCGRPVHRLGDSAGRSPGLRVVACVRPSQFPSGQSGRRLAADSCGGSYSLWCFHQLRIPSFLPGFHRGTSTRKAFIVVVPESRRCPPGGRLAERIFTARGFGAVPDEKPRGQNEGGRRPRRPPRGLNRFLLLDLLRWEASGLLRNLRHESAETDVVNARSPSSSTRDGRSCAIMQLPR